LAVPLPVVPPPAIKRYIARCALFNRFVLRSITPMAEMLFQHSANKKLKRWAKSAGTPIYALL